MPSYVLNPFLDLDEILCKKFLDLNLQGAPKTTIIPVGPFGHRKSPVPCSPTISSSSLTFDSMDGAVMTSGHWGQQSELSCPGQSRWNKKSLWGERSVSMVEASVGSIPWGSLETSHCKQATATSPTGSAPGSCSSSRYKTELCRTFAESGICKYGGKCQFAHGPEELRDLSRHPKYKTEPCRTFHTIGFCPYGIRCHFVHNNEDDQGPARRSRPPLLRQSVSFAGFPTNPPLPEPSLSQPFLQAVPGLSLSPLDIPELLSPAFPDTGSFSVFDAALDPKPQFLPSPDMGCSLCRHAPHSSVSQVQTAGQISSQGSSTGSALGSRSLSYTSLSDHEGGSGSSASSLSGSESSVFEGVGRRLPIFSQLSVPDDGFGEGGDCIGFLF